MCSSDLFAAAAAQAQTEPAKDAQKGPQDRVASGPLTPEVHIADMEKAAAKRQQDAGTGERVRFFRFHTAREQAEFEALGRYAVMLLTVLSQKSEELPVKRVYIRAGGSDVPVQQVSSWRSEVDEKLLAAKVYGRPTGRAGSCCSCRATAPRPRAPPRFPIRIRRRTPSPI